MTLKESLLKNIGQTDKSIEKMQTIEKWLDAYTKDDDSKMQHIDGVYRQQSVYESGKYEIHGDGTLDILTDVAVFLEEGEESFPNYIKFGKIYGNFVVAYRVVMNDCRDTYNAKHMNAFHIGGEQNLLKNLKHFPRSIKGKLRIYGPNLETLKGDCEVCGGLDITAPKLKTLDGIPTITGHEEYGRSIELRGMDKLKEVDLSYMSKAENIRLELSNISNIKLPHTIRELTVIMYGPFLHTNWLEGVDVTRIIKVMHHHTFYSKIGLKSIGFNPKPGSKVSYYKKENYPVKWFSK